MRDQWVHAYAAERKGEGEAREEEEEGEAKPGGLGIGRPRMPLARSACAGEMERVRLCNNNGYLWCALHAACQRYGTITSTAKSS